MTAGDSQMLNRWLWGKAGSATWVQLADMVCPLLCVLFRHNSQAAPAARQGECPLIAALAFPRPNAFNEKYFQKVRLEPVR
jgi:hypothetical protein